jgi:hypothetical protein
MKEETFRLVIVILAVIFIAFYVYKEIGVTSKFGMGNRVGRYFPLPGPSGAMIDTATGKVYAAKKLTDSELVEWKELIPSP